MVKLSEFSTLVPYLFKTLSMVEPGVSRVEVAKTFNLPIEFIENLSKALYEYYVPTRLLTPIEKLETAATIGLQTQAFREVEQLQIGRQTFLGAN
jgi:hypothetical protein